MRRISEIFCDLVMANWAIHSCEHVKMREFAVGDSMDRHVATEMDTKTRVESEKRKALFNEMNDAMAEVIGAKKYDWKGL